MVLAPTLLQLHIFWQASNRSRIRVRVEKLTIQVGGAAKLAPVESADMSGGRRNTGKSRLNDREVARRRTSLSGTG